MLISGYGAVFNKPDLFGDIIMPNAFTQIPKVKMLYGHEGREIGEWLEIKQNDKGLYVIGRIDDETTTQAVEDGTDGLSIGYRTLSAHERKHARTGIITNRIIHKILLAEISIVFFPANPEARIITIN